MSDQSIQDVTQRVYGTFEDGVTMILFVGKEKIGRLILTGHGKEIDLKEGYVYRENRFFRCEDDSSPVSQYVADCDLGWC